MEKVKLPIKDLADAPWWSQYPPESKTIWYQDPITGKWVEYTTEYSNSDSGLYFPGVKGGNWNWAAGLGFFFGASAGSKTLSGVGILGIPASVTFRGPECKLQGGIGSDFLVSLSGIDITIAGIKVGLDLGWGSGLTPSCGRIGPLSLGLDKDMIADIGKSGVPPETLW